VAWRVSDLRSGQVLGDLVTLDVGDATKVRRRAARLWSREADDLVVVDLSRLTVPLLPARPAPRKKKR
jgi:hypothetical protein